MSMGAHVLLQLPCLRNAWHLLLMAFSKVIMPLFLLTGRPDLGKHIHTIGTSFKDGYQAGLIPQVMNALFSKVESLNHRTEFQLHVSFIEILKEEVLDLLEPTCLSKSEGANGHSGKVTIPGKPPIHIRESSNGVITLSGSTEVSVSSLKEMSACLEQGSLSRATGSTNMNNQLSRSHAIFTITMEQMRRLNPVFPADGSPEGLNEEYLCAKLHLVDLSGSERAKRTGSDGLRFKEDWDMLLNSCVRKRETVYIWVLAFSAETCWPFVPVATNSILSYRCAIFLPPFRKFSSGPLFSAYQSFEPLAGLMS